MPGNAAHVQPAKNGLSLGLWEGAANALIYIVKTGRSERIRTSGPCLPKTVLYQAELRSDRGA